MGRKPSTSQWLLKALVWFFDCFVLFCFSLNTGEGIIIEDVFSYVCSSVQTFLLIVLFVIISELFLTAFLTSLPFWSPHTVGFLCVVTVTPYHDRDLYQGLGFSSPTRPFSGNYLFHSWDGKGSPTCNQLEVGLPASILRHFFNLVSLQPQLCHTC